MFSFNEIVFVLTLFLLSFLTTLLVRRIALKKSLLDFPNERSSHSIPTPRGGGIAVVFSWLTGMVYLYIVKGMDNVLFYALLSGLPISLVGLADDVFNLKPGIRFVIQFFCAGLALYFLKGLQIFDLGFYKIEWSVFLTFLSLIAIVWAVNLFNFLDGIDGYIATEIIFIGVSCFVITGEMIGLLLAAASGGFLILNWQKAKIFMGDVGSTLLGFIVAVLAIYYQNSEKTSLIVWLILTSVFWLDATVTLFRRIKNKEKLSTAHRNHAYQRMVQAGWSHQKTTLFALLLNGVGFLLAFLAIQYNTFSLIFLLLDIAILFLVLRYVDSKKPFPYLKKN